MTIKCLLNTIHIPNVQQGVARCDKTMNKYITKTGEDIVEVICDYGKGIVTKSEIKQNKIKNILSDGSLTIYTKAPLGRVLINENGTETLSRNSDLWNKLLRNLYKGFNK